MELVVYIVYATVALGIFIALIPLFVFWWVIKKKRYFQMITNKEVSFIVTVAFIGWGLTIILKANLLLQYFGFLILSATSIFFLLFFGGVSILYIKKKLLMYYSKNLKK